MRALLVLIAGVSFVFMGFRQSPKLPEIKEAEAFVPRTEAVKWMSLGYNSAAASLFWVNGILAYSETMFDGKTFKWLSHLADASTQLDSLFKTPYVFVAAITSSSDPDTADYSVLHRGIATFPDDWRLAISAALRFANGPSKNYTLAAQIMEKYKGDTAAPEHIRSIYRLFELQSMPVEIALIQIIDDYMNPNYQTFQRGLEIKAARVLGVAPGNEISGIFEEMTKTKNPQLAFDKLLELRNHLKH